MDKEQASRWPWRELAEEGMKQLPLTFALGLLQLPPQAPRADPLKPLPPLGVDGLGHPPRQVCQRFAHLPRLNRRVASVQLGVRLLQQLDPDLGRGHASAKGRDEAAAVGVDGAGDARIHSDVVPVAVLVELNGDEASVEEEGVGDTRVHLLQGPEDLLHHVRPAGHHRERPEEVAVLEDPLLHIGHGAARSEEERLLIGWHELLWPEPSMDLICQLLPPLPLLLIEASVGGKESSQNLAPSPACSRRARTSSPSTLSAGLTGSTRSSYTTSDSAMLGRFRSASSCPLRGWALRSLGVALLGEEAGDLSLEDTASYPSPVPCMLFPPADRGLSRGTNALELRVMGCCSAPSRLLTRIFLRMEERWLWLSRLVALL
eukprot:757300-Hanusia_phi.AAC.2